MSRRNFQGPPLIVEVRDAARQQNHEEAEDWFDVPEPEPLEEPSVLQNINTRTTGGQTNYGAHREASQNAGNGAGGHQGQLGRHHTMGKSYRNIGQRGGGISKRDRIPLNQLVPEDWGQGKR